MAGFLESNRFVVLGSVAIVMVGLMGSGFLLGDGLRRAKEADREVTVKGVSERDVTADIATWTVSFSDNGSDLASVQGSVDQQAQAVRKFSTEAGFKPSDFTDSDISLMREQPRDAYGNPLPENLTVSRSIQLRTNDVMKARAAYAKQADLLRRSGRGPVKHHSVASLTPTGTPPGICTMDSNESSPSVLHAFMGTPSTGNGVKAAVTPAKCAAPPAAAITTSKPRSTAPFAQSCSKSGVRCADITLASHGTSNALSWLTQFSITDQSE